MIYDLLKKDNYVKYFNSNCSQNDKTFIDFISDVYRTYKDISSETIEIDIFNNIERLKQLVFDINEKNIYTRDFIFSIPNQYFEAFDNFDLFCLLHHICSPGYIENGDCIKAANNKIIYNIIKNIK